MEDFTLGPVHLKAWHITLRCMLEEFHWMMWHNRHIWGLPVCIYPTTQHNTLIYCMLKTVVMRPVTVTGQRHSPPDSTVVVEPVRVLNIQRLENSGTPLALWPRASHAAPALIQRHGCLMQTWHTYISRTISRGCLGAQVCSVTLLHSLKQQQTLKAVKIFSPYFSWDHCLYSVCIVLQ